MEKPVLDNQEVTAKTSKEEIGFIKANVGIANRFTDLPVNRFTALKVLQITDEETGIFYR